MGKKKEQIENLQAENGRLRELVFSATLTAISTGDYGFQKQLERAGLGHVIAEAQSVLDDVNADDDEDTPDDVVDAEFDE